MIKIFFVKKYALLYKFLGLLLLKAHVKSIIIIILL